MSAEPALPRADILAAVWAAYGLELTDISFLADGTAHAYRLEGRSGRYFLKLLPHTPYGREAAERLHTEGALLHALRGLGMPRVPQLLPTPAGASSTQIQGYGAFLYAWIDAQNVGDGWGGLPSELAALLGQLHRLTPDIVQAVSVLPFPPETFDLPFEEALQADLETLWTGDLSGRPAAQILRELLWPVRQSILDLLAQAREFQSAVRARPPELVVCHTDAHGWNVMRDKGGQLWLVDWESCRLAPPEHDLWMFGERLRDVLPAYCAARGQAFAPDRDLLGFYTYRRTLEDLSMDIGWLLHHEPEPVQDANTLRIVREYNLPAIAATRQNFLRMIREVGV